MPKVNSFTIVNPVGGKPRIGLLLEDGWGDWVVFETGQYDHFTAACVLLTSVSVSYDPDTRAFVHESFRIASEPALSMSKEELEEALRNISFNQDDE